MRKIDKSPGGFGSNRLTVVEGPTYELYRDAAMSVGTDFGRPFLESEIELFWDTGISVAELKIRLQQIAGAR